MDTASTASCPEPLTQAVRLRGHHLLCLLGYRGMGYSEEYVRNMTDIYETLRQGPQTIVEIVAGPDALCQAFPCSLPNHCEDANVCKRDQTVLTALALAPGDTVAWATILDRVATAIRGSDIERFCSTCSWRAYGVCEDGVNRVGQHLELPAVGDPSRRDSA